MTKKPLSEPQHAEAFTAPSAQSVHPSSERVLGRAEVHGKVILIGEHAVVYGQPAIALPLLNVTTQVELTRHEGHHIDSDLYVGLAALAPDEVEPVRAALRAASIAVGLPENELGVQIRSQIPVARGLGSSAAMAAAIVGAASAASGVKISEQERYEIIQAAERVAHGTPSGLDARTVVADHPLLFQRGDAQPLSVGKDLNLIVADSGAPSSTARALKRVRELSTAQPELVDNAMAEIGVGVLKAKDALTAGDIHSLGEQLNQAHSSLRILGVSTPQLDALVAAATSAHAIGAKLTGGGLGGCIIALASSSQGAIQISDALLQAGATRVWSMVMEAS